MLTVPIDVPRIRSFTGNLSTTNNMASSAGHPLSRIAIAPLPRILTAAALLILLTALRPIAANRSANWPPQKFLEVFNVPSAVAMCRDKFPINEAIVLAFENAASVEEASGADRDLKCYMLCVLTQMGLMRDGTMTYRKLIHTIDELPPTVQERFFNMGKNCYTREEDACDRAYHMLACWKRNSPDDFFLF